MNTIPNAAGHESNSCFVVLGTKGEKLCDYSQHNVVKLQRCKKSNAGGKKRQSKESCN